MNQHSNINSPTKAVIYCRVSGKKQASEGSGLKSQEHRCREYAAQRGYHVDAVFPDDVSGGGDFMNRKGMVALLAYLDAQPQENYVVIFDDLKRYARDTEFHLKLRRIMAERGATRECLNFNFENTPEGKFIETMLAAQGELEREQNGRQVIQKMKARVEQGFWVFQAPIGYKYAKSQYGGKQLVPDEPVASVIREALEGFATGRFKTQAEVMRFLEGMPEYPKSANGKIHFSRIKELIERPVYAGYIDAPNWDISLRKGRHEALISYQQYLKNQERMKEDAVAPARANIDDDFVLRGTVNCSACNRQLTSSWSKSRNGKMHPYYRCYYRECERYGKSIRRDDLEAKFDEIFKPMQLPNNAVELVKIMLKNAWQQKLAQAKYGAKAIKEDIAKIEKQIEHLLNRIVDSTSNSVISAYEAKIEKLEKKKLIALEKLENQSKPKHTFEELFEPAIALLTNPWNIWRFGCIDHRRLVLRMAFSKRISYDRETGSLNTKKAIPFSVLSAVLSKKKEMVELSGFEPLTSSLPAKRSPN